MARETVDFGIDLGTTNSAIAVSTGADAELLRNVHHLEHTPSAVRISPSGRLQVGTPAKSRLDSDPDNTHTEFKLAMGVRDAHRAFPASGRTMTVEELSAEVLKSLRQDVTLRLAERMTAAVITVPAAFGLDQCAATRRAATLAGLDFAPLIQEPTAAAWAYGARAAEVPKRGFWLVYDFGGGTFDAAVIHIEDGRFTVINHAGDNHLGGNRIDWALVDGLLVPAVRAEGRFLGLDRADPGQRGNIAVLKTAAEHAKIALSHLGATEVEVELTDDRGDRAELTVELTRAELDGLAMPVYQRSIELCRGALREKGLTPGDIERVLLVGGPTLAPALRALLADPGRGLGIAVDHSLDPVTAVARGAAIFARTQRLPRTAVRHPTAADQVLLDFAHKPAGRDDDPLLGGRAHTVGARDWTGYTIEFVATAGQHPRWRSGTVPLQPGGTFTTRLRADTDHTTYLVELRTPGGTRVPTDPDHTTYQRLTMVGGDSTLNHSVGVWLAGDEVEWLLRKGTELPARKTVVLRSTADVHRGDRAGLIRVRLVQGERDRADRNTVVCRLDVRLNEISRDLPIGSEVEVTLEIDRSVIAHAEVFIPILDEGFDVPVNLGRAAAPGRTELRDLSERIAAHYRDLRRRARAARAHRTSELLDAFDRGGGLDAIGGELNGAATTPDAAAACAARLREAQTVLDEAADALKLPQLINDAQTALRWVNELVDQRGGGSDRSELQRAERELHDAIEEGEPTALHLRTRRVRAIGLRVLDSTGHLPVLRFASFKEHFATSSDPRIRMLLREGDQALNARDRERLQAVVSDLSREAGRRRPPGGDLDTSVGRRG